MGLEGVDIVEVGLPVLHKAIVVSGHHPNPIVTPHHASHRTVMTLYRAHHRLELIFLYKAHHSPRLTSLTWRIDSKLKLVPFQSVNSPLCAPVTSRRPSGTHWMQGDEDDTLYPAHELLQVQRTYRCAEDRATRLVG